MKEHAIHHRTLTINGVSIFFREAGPANAPVVLLMHGYPTSSFMFRNLIPILSRQYHVIAPDLPGFGFSDAPAAGQFEYTFDNLAKTMQSFIEALSLKRFSIYVFDYGAPVGYRLVLANPEKITGIISQNGNAYEAGLSTGWNPVQKQYFLDRPGNVEIQLDLLKDYQTNVALYPAFQAYFRKYQPRLLAVWGNKDPYFLPAGAEAHKNDNPNATVKFYDTGHFALETHGEEIAGDILTFLATLPE